MSPKDITGFIYKGETHTKECTTKGIRNATKKAKSRSPAMRKSSKRIASKGHKT